MLQAKQRVQEAEKAINQFVETRLKDVSTLRRPQFYREIGAVCLKAGMFDQAEKWFRQGDDGSPVALRAYVLALAQQDKIETALKICENRFVQEPQGIADLRNNALVIQMIMGLISRPRIPADDRAGYLEMIEPVVSAAEQQLRGDASAMDAIATLRLVQGKRDQAIELYREAVRLKPESPVYLNNLATALASDPAAAGEAMDFLEKAIQVHGSETRELLDTKASILIHDDPAQAEAIWRELHYDRADPRVTFGLADALFRQGKMEESRQMLEVAMERGLLDQILTPYQQQRLDRMQGEHVNAVKEESNDQE